MSRASRSSVGGRAAGSLLVACLACTSCGAGSPQVADAPRATTANPTAEPPPLTGEQRRRLEAAATGRLGRFRGETGFASVGVDEQGRGIVLLWKGDLPLKVAREVAAIRPEFPVAVTEVRYSRRDLAVAIRRIEAAAAGTPDEGTYLGFRSTDYDALLVGVEDPGTVDRERLSEIAGVAVELEEIRGGFPPSDR